jgi:hypothetical protein
MKAKSTSQTRAPKKSQEPTIPIQLRVRREHVEAIDKIAAERGTIRAAQVQQAIAEYIERMSK